MKAKILILNFLIIIVCFSCLHKTSKKERSIKLEYALTGEPIFYETKHASIVFDKNDVIKNIRDYLSENEQFDRQVFLDYLLQTKDTIVLSPDTVFATKSDTISSKDNRFLLFFGYEGKNDTIIQVRDMSDVRNYYVEPMFWSAYELIKKGKCEITSKTDLQKVERIKIVYHKVPINTKYTEFFFENDTLFFYALTQIGL